MQGWHHKSKIWAGHWQQHIKKDECSSCEGLMSSKQLVFVRNIKTQEMQQHFQKEYLQSGGHNEI